VTRQNKRREILQDREKGKKKKKGRRSGEGQKGKREKSEFLWVGVTWSARGNEGKKKRKKNRSGTPYEKPHGHLTGKFKNRMRPGE